MINRLSRWQQFPWRENNQFQFLIDGSEIFPAMLEAIDSAQTQILLEMYLIESGTVADLFVAALTAAAKRDVTVCLLLDDYGARGFEQKDRLQLEAAGVNTVYYNPIGFWNPVLIWGWHRSMLRDHRKILVIDSRVVFVGGMGIADNFDNTRMPESYWHDVAVKIEGPGLKATGNEVAIETLELAHEPDRCQGRTCPGGWLHNDFEAQRNSTV